MGVAFEFIGIIKLSVMHRCGKECFASDGEQPELIMLKTSRSLGIDNKRFFCFFVIRFLERRHEGRRERGDEKIGVIALGLCS